MTVHESSSVALREPIDRVVPWVSDLSRYCEWMPLVHAATSVGEDVWDVELRATIGVFARSKRLRMRRTVFEPGRIVFERSEDDGRTHAPWILEVVVATHEGGTLVTMDMTYKGGLWTAGVLDRVLAHNIEAGKKGLVRVVQGA